MRRKSDLPLYIGQIHAFYFDTTSYTLNDNVNTKSIWLNNSIDVCLWCCIETTWTMFQTLLLWEVNKDNSIHQIRFSGIWFSSMVIRYDHGWNSIFLYWCVMHASLMENTNFQRKQCWEYGIIHKNMSFTITDNAPISKSTKSGSWNR